MKTKNGFTLLENMSEVRTWLNGQTVTRSITKLQVHHMGLPDYSCWESDQKKADPHLTRTINLDSYGKTTWGSNDGKGKYIAQHFNVFPDGKITTGRSLNSNPIGISGWNANAICVEIYGNFDKGKDTMTAAQKNAVIGLYGELCKRFKITPSASTIRYHAWFTSGGQYLGNYIAGKSRKTCPGTNFFGGNTMTAFNANFLSAVKNYINNGSVVTLTPSPGTSFTVKINTSTLNIRKGPSTNNAVVGTVKKGEVYTIIETNGEWGLLKSKAGWINLNYVIKQ